MSGSEIHWLTVQVGTSAKTDDKYLMKVEHFLDARTLRAFLDRISLWLVEHDQSGRVTGEPWRVDQAQRKGLIGTLRFVSERLYSLDPVALRDQWTALAADAHEHVEEQRRWEAERAEPFLRALRGEQ